MRYLINDERRMVAAARGRAMVDEARSAPLPPNPSDDYL